MPRRTDSFSHYDDLLAAAPLSDPWTHAEGQAPAYEPDYQLLGELLTVPVRASALSESGIFAKGIDSWIAHELRRAGFAPDEVWPRPQRPRVLPRDIATLLEKLPAELRADLAARIERLPAVAPVDARILGRAYVKQVDVCISRWDRGPEILVSTKAQLSSFRKNLPNRFEESYGDAGNLRARYPLAAVGFFFVQRTTILTAEPDAFELAVDMIRKLRDHGDGTGYTTTGLLLVEWDGNTPPPTVRARPDLVPQDIAPSRFLADLVQHVLGVNPIAHHVRVRSLMERRFIPVPEADSTSDDAPAETQANHQARQLPPAPGQATVMSRARNLVGRPGSAGESGAAGLDGRAGLGDAAEVSAGTACFRLCSGESWRAPWPMYGELRDHDPAHHVEDGDYWVLSRYSDVQAAVLDTELYSSAAGLTVGYDELAAAGLKKAVPLVMLDPPEHTEFRELIGRGYTPRRVAAIEPAVRRFVRARLDAIAELGECDIIAELFRPVPGFVVAGYLGVPEADRGRFDGWTRGIVQSTAEGNPPAAATSAELFGYFADLIARRRAEPADDTISDLVRLMDGDPAGTLRILGFAFTMIAGGNDTATGLLGGAAELLTVNPGQRRLLAGRPDRLPGAIEELLRLTSPVQCLARTLTRGTTVHGRAIPGGRKVLLLYGSANRDPRAFGASAEELDILRGRRIRARHLAFAIGPHHCLGAAAARLQARIVLTELLDRFPRFAVDPAAGTFAAGHYTRRHATLPFTTSG